MAGRTMGEHTGYTCDGGCGANAIKEGPGDSIARQGWFTTFTPTGYPTLYTCSMECLIHALQGIGGRGLPAARIGGRQEANDG